MTTRLMNLEEAEAIIAAGDKKYGRAFQMLCDWQYNGLELLRDKRAISHAGFERMVTVPQDRKVAEGGRGGPWIGSRTLSDAEVIDNWAVARFVFQEALDAHTVVSGVEFLPFIAPGVSQALTEFRAELRQSLGGLGRLICATPLGRFIYTRPYVHLIVLNAVLDAAEQHL